MRIPLVASVLALVVVSPAMAQKNQTINIKMPPEHKIITEAFDAATKNITQEQKAHLEFLTKEHVKTLEPDIEILTQAVNLEPCMKAGLIQEGDAKNFLKFRDHRNMVQDRMRNQFDHMYLAKVDFMDRELLRQHLLMQQMIQLQLVGQMAMLSQKTMTPEKLQTECPKFKAYINDYMVKNGL